MAAKGKEEERIEIRLPTVAKQQIECTTQLQGRSVSDSIITAAPNQAIKIIEQRNLIRPPSEDSETPAQAVLNELQLNAKAVRAAKHYKGSTDGRPECHH